MAKQIIVPTEQLVPVFNSEIGGQTMQVCDARALHSYLGVGKVFASWLEGRIEKYGFVENQDFISFSQNGEKPTGGRPSIEYHLTLDMAKELAMVENNAKGREVRRYFIAMEKKALELVTQQPSFTNLVATTRAWAVMTQAQADAAKIQADMAKTQADVAQAQADKARALADEYERRVAAEAKSSPVPQSSSSPKSQPALLPTRELAFIHAWWNCSGNKTVTASDLYRAVATEQCQELNNSSGALLGDVAQWTPKKLSYALKRWSQLVLDSFAVFNIGKSSRGNLWRLERKG